MSGLGAWRLLAGALGVAVAAAIGAGSQVTYGVEQHTHAILRLAWRARGERVRECRRRSAEEMAKLPVHMRQEEVCERRILPYRLRVAVDDLVRVDRVVRPGGARADRPLFVFDDLALTPGTHAIQVTFEREGPLTVLEPGVEEPIDETEAARRRSETPARLALRQAVALGPGRIVLVTYDDERRALRLNGGP